MAHPQSSPRGFIAKGRLDVGTQQLTDGNSYLDMNRGIRVSGVAGGVLTASATQLVLAQGIKLNDAQGLKGDSTGFVFGNSTSVIPSSVDNGLALAVVSNSTGFALAVNTSGTSWKYLSVTSVQAT